MKPWTRVAAMALFWWGLAGCGSPDSAPAPTVDPGTPQEILRHFEMQDIRGGVRQMTLKSDEGRVFESAQRTDLTNPVVTFYRDGAATSRLRAPSGSIDMKTHDVDTWGGVQVVTTDSTTLTTDKLRYDAQTRKISSKDHVTLDKPDSITEGEGLMTDPELHDVTIGHQTVRMKHAARK